MPDAHIPDEDPQAMECAIAAADYWRPDTVIVLGDWLDNAAFSRHGKQTVTELEQPRYSDNMRRMCSYLLRLTRRGANLVFIEGNHEAWVERWCVQQGGHAAQDIYAAMAPRKYVEEAVPGVTWVPYMAKDVTRYEVAPNLWACHGWRHSTHAASAHAKLVPGLSILFGHTHRMQMDTYRNPATGEVLEARSFGCLAKLQPYYAHGAPTAWVHGFGMLYQSRKDPADWTCYSVVIQDGSCVLPCGKKIAKRKPRIQEAS